MMKTWMVTRLSNLPSATWEAHLAKLLKEYKETSDDGIRAALDISIMATISRIEQAKRKELAKAYEESEKTFREYKERVKGL